MQDLGKERVEERVTGLEGVEDEVEAMNEKVSLLLKFQRSKQKKDVNHTILVMKN